MEPIFHVTRAADWRAAQARGTYRISTRDRTLEEEGFIHCSYAHQVAHVVATYFRDVDELLVLVIDPRRVNAEIRDESAGGDERFPHIYGPLNLDAVIETRPAPWGELRNWAGNIHFSTDRVHHPETVGQVQEVVRNSQQVRVLGSRHSFNAIADSSGDLISLDRLEPVLEVDAQRRQVTIDGGVTYGRLAPGVHTAGFALHNTASLPHITVAGACATATHGSGSRNGILGSRVVALEIVTADGTLRTLSRADDGDRFAGAVVGLGGLGVVTRLTLDVSPTFDMYQFVYENLPLVQVENNFDAIMSSGYSVSLFTDWRESRFNQTWIKTVATRGDAAAAAPTFYGATLATRDMHPLPTLDPATCTPQMGVVGAWHERLPHFRAEFEPSYGEELQSEYFVPRAQAPAALRAIDGMRGEVAPLVQMSEVRTIAADDLWMSPFYRRDCVALHFTWRYDWEGVQQLLPRIEERLAPFDARPHWGKLFTIPAPTLRARYKRLPDFRALLKSLDPEGKFRNTFLETFVFG